MNHNQLKQKIIAYLDASYHWDEKADAAKMEEAEKEIFQHFELPFHEKRLCAMLRKTSFSKQNKESIAEKHISAVIRKYNKYLIDDSYRAVELLSAAKNGYLHADDVLPVIGVPLKKYNRFVYYDIFMRGLCTEQQLLFVYKKHQQLESLNQTIPEDYAALSAPDIYWALQTEGTPFIGEYKEFLKHEYIECTMKEFFDTVEGEENPDAPDVYLEKFSKFFITDISYDKSYDGYRYYISLLKPENEDKKISIGLDASLHTIKTILLHAKYYTLSIPAWNNIARPKIVSDRTGFDILGCIGNYLEIENLTMEIEVERWEYNGKQHYTYKLTKLYAGSDLKKPRTYYEENDDTLSDDFPLEEEELPF